MKKTLALLASLLLASCQLPLTTKVTGEKIPSAGKASLAVTVATHGFRYAPQSSLTGGRFVVPPTLIPGVAEYLLEDPANLKTDVVGDSNTGLGDIPPGTWKLTVTQKNYLDQVVAVGDLTVSLSPGANTATVILIPTQTGNGTLDVPFSWTTDSVSAGQFILDRLTISGTAPSYSVEATSVPVVAGVDYTIDIGAKTARFTKVLPSGSYQLVLSLSHSENAHPPVTATAEVFDNMVSTMPTMALTSVHLAGPPPAPSTPSLSLSYGTPTLTWSGTPSTAQGFRLYRDGVEVSLVEGNDSMGYIQDSTHQSGFAYNYTVRAYNGFGESADSPSVPFQSVGFVGTSIGGTIRIQAGGTVPLTAMVTPGGATFPGVEWSVSNPVVGTYSALGTQAHALTLGTSTITATSVESQALSGSVALQVEAYVTTLAGQAGTDGIVDGFGSAALFNMPNVLTMGPDDALYTVDTLGSVRRISQDGTVTTLSTETFTSVRGIAVDDALNVYLSTGHAVLRVPQNSPSYLPSEVLAGDLSTSGSTDGVGASARFSAPAGLALSPDQLALYVADSANHRIRKIIVSTGVTSSVVADGTAGNMDGPIVNSQLNQPWSLVCDADGNLYIGCAGSYVIKYANFGAGNLTQLVGTPGISASVDGDSTVAGFVQPLGLALDGNYLYVADYNSSIRRVALPAQWATPSLAQVITIGGSSGSPGTTDGLGLNARFGTQTAVAARAGVVWVADTDNHTIRKLQVSAFDSIGPFDSQFANVDVMKYNSISTYLYTGDGQTGLLREGSILLYNTPLGNKGKLLVTGIDPSYNSISGNWRMHLRYCTWDSGATIVAEGDLLYENNQYSSQYVDLDTGSLVLTSTDGDIYLSGIVDGSRLFNAAAVGVLMGIYQ